MQLYAVTRVSWREILWLLKKSGFLPDSQKLGDTKCLEN